jgi:hypothetical protein
MHASLVECHILFAGLGLQLTPLLPSSSEPTGLCSTLVSAGPRLYHVLPSAPGLLRDGMSEPCLTDTGPCRARDMHRPNSSETDYIINCSRGTATATYQVVEFRKLSKFSKMLEIVQKAHKTKKIEIFHLQIFFKIFNLF